MPARSHTRSLKKAARREQMMRRRRWLKIQRRLKKRKIHMR